MEQTMDAILSGIDISVGYQHTTIIPPQCVEIPRGKITSIIGPNGCGKSTLLKALSRMMPVQSGQIVLDGQMIAQLPTLEVARRMAILPQSPQAPGGLTVEELVAYGRYPHQKGFGRCGRTTTTPFAGRWRSRTWMPWRRATSMRFPAASGSAHGSPWRWPRIRR